ncbi:MAG: hypothetical protein ROW39_05485 [Anaerolineaceae bacterium]
MRTGMLWFDNDPKTDLSTKIHEAASYYQKKYGTKPDVCFIHPSMVAQGKPHQNGIEVRTNRMVLPHHIWIGVRETQAVMA